VRLTVWRKPISSPVISGREQFLSDDIVECVLEKQLGTDRMLIVVDQFEELYTLTSDEEACRQPGSAIRKPAEKIQLGLVRHILNDVGDEPGNLPLLAYPFR
jgi:hypothetical protein